jgi:hypothetical protein
MNELSVFSEKSKRLGWKATSAARSRGVRRERFILS